MFETWSSIAHADRTKTVRYLGVSLAGRDGPEDVELQASIARQQRPEI